MARKSVKGRKKQPATKRSTVTEAQAIVQLAEAIKALADAIVSQKAPPQPSQPLVPFSATDKIQVSDVFATALSGQPVARTSPARLPALTGDDILQGIRAIFKQPKLTLESDLNALIQGGAAALVAMWEDIDEKWEPFRIRGLELGPSDLRPVSSVKDLVGVIAWGLRNALPR